MPQALFLFLVRFIGSFVAVCGFCGRGRGTPGSLVWSKVRGGDPLVGLTLGIVLDQDRWCLYFQGLTDYSEFLWGLWLAVWERNFETGTGLFPWLQLCWSLQTTLAGGLHVDTTWTFVAQLEPNHHAKSFYQISKDTFSFITYSLYSMLINI